MNFEQGIKNNEIEKINSLFVFLIFTYNYYQQIK